MVSSAERVLDSMMRQQFFSVPRRRLLLQSETMLGKPVAHNCGLLSMDSGLLLGIVACFLGYLAVQVLVCFGHACLPCGA